MKYELTERSLYNSRGKKLFHIKALKDFGHIKKGQLGGLVQGEHNLSHEGDCWIYPHASACDSSKVTDDAELKDFCRITDYAKLRDNAVMQDEATLEGCGSLSGNAVMMNNSLMTGRSSASGDAIVSKSPVYIYAGKVHVTITDNHVTVTSVKHSNQYTKQEWFEVTDKYLEKKYGIVWRVKWKHILNNIIHQS